MARRTYRASRNASNLETITVVTFIDGEKRFGRKYAGVAPFAEGDRISLLESSDNMPVAPGDYVVRRAPGISHQLGIDFDKAKGRTATDILFRYFVCRKVRDHKDTAAYAILG